MDYHHCTQDTCAEAFVSSFVEFQKGVHTLPSPDKRPGEKKWEQWQAESTVLSLTSHIDISLAAPHRLCSVTFFCGWGA